jgi:hypothetical protein
LPAADLVIANLIIEYIGYEHFANAVRKAAPKYVSCVIQVNGDDCFVSESPWLGTLAILEKQLFGEVEAIGLTDCLQDLGYARTSETEYVLPGSKRFQRLDFQARLLFPRMQ